jgi:glucosamine--fructose-6-phosphate aminotransferase (isomerizing)
MLSAELSGSQERFAQLNQLPDVMVETLTMNPLIKEIAPRYRYMQHCVIIGRGFNYATAFEMALKMKELTYTIVEPYSSADFLHGPMALIESGFPVVIIAPSGILQGEMASFLSQVNERQAETLVISDVPELLASSRIPMALPKSVPEWLSPLNTILPGQLFSMYLAATRDYDVDFPRGLRKVTETR